MPPIPIYSQSPINAAKATGVTPATGAPPEGKTARGPGTLTAGADPCVDTPVDSPAAAQPGAAPSLPRETGSSVQPTPTQGTAYHGPPPPQPGAVPVAPGSAPPRTGEPHGGPPRPQQTAAAAPSATPAPSYPPQMAMPPLRAAPPYPPARGTATTAGAARPMISQPTNLFLSEQAPAMEARDLSHPPGYAQDMYAGEMNSSQRAAAAAASARLAGEDGGTGDDEGVWDAAKKLAKTAGERLSAAESEVWRRINKG